MTIASFRRTGAIHWYKLISTSPPLVSWDVGGFTRRILIRRLLPKKFIDLETTEYYGTVGWKDRGT